MKIFSSFVISILLIFNFSKSQTTDTLKVGDLAPNFSLKSIDGELEFLHNWTVKKNRQLRKPAKQPNKHVVVFTFSGTWCPPCVKQLNPLEKLYQKFKDDHVKFFIIDNTKYFREDPPNDWDGFSNAPITSELFKEMNINMTVLEDKNISIAKKYEITVVPKIFLIDKNQVIRKMIIGYDDSKLITELSTNIDELLKN